MRPFLYEGGSIMGKLARGALVAVKAGLIYFTVLILCAATAWSAQDQNLTTVYAVGSSSIHGADMVAGRNDAIADSLVAAVTQVLNGLVPPETLQGNFQAISATVLSRTDQFISDYQMLTEATHDNTHRVMVKATVSVARLKEALNQSGIYIGEKKYPRVLYCIAEKLVGQVGYHYWWSGQPVMRSGLAAEIIAQIAKDKGFSEVPARMGQTMEAYPPELSVPEAVALGQQMQADVVVVGQAVAEETPNTMGASLRSFRGTVAIHAYSVRNGRQVGQAQREAVVTGNDPDTGGRQALDSASHLAGEDFAAQVAEAWFSTGMSSSKIEIHVEGIGGHIADFVKFRGSLSTLSGVDSVERKEIQADAAVLLVDYQGSARALADALMRQSFDAFGLNITEPQGNIIRLQIVPR
jgi:hypothetical protein